MAPHPGVDVDQIRDKARKGLLDLLESVRGKKNLVIEKALAGPISLLIKASTLQQYGVDKFFFLENDNVDSSQRNVVFLARGENAEKTLSIVEQIKRLQQDNSIEHDISIFFVPRRTFVSNKILEDAGVLGDVSVEEYQLSFIPLDQDVLSLELEDSFRDLFLRKDPTCIFLAAKALMAIQQSHGLFPRIIGKGDQAHRLLELLLRMRAGASTDEASGSSALGMMPSAGIESLIVIDREVDFLTVLLTQLTYEGFIDEIFGIKDNSAEIDTSVVGHAPGLQKPPGATAPQEGMKRKIMLDSTDKLYEQLRDANFATVGGLLNNVARRLQSEYGDTRYIDAKSTAELKDFVKKLPGYQTEQQSLKIHTGLAEEVTKYTRSDRFIRTLEVEQNLTQGADPASQHDSIEEMMARDIPLSVVLRLLCIESCVSGGLRPKELETFKTMILQAYGHQHLLTLDRLEKMGLLVPRTGGSVLGLPAGVGNAAAVTKTNYGYLRRAIRLVVDEVDETNPNDIAYVYSGYAPLSVRLVQCVVQKTYLQDLINNNKHVARNGNTANNPVLGWQGFEDTLKAVRGQTFNKVQKGDEAATKARGILSGIGGKKTIVVMFLGGITRTEIAALRFLSKSDEGRKIVICTTGIIGGNLMMDAALERRSFSFRDSA